MTPDVTAQLLAAFVTLMVVIDPVGIAPLFGTLTRSHPELERRQIALRAVLVAGGVLLFFALMGRPTLAFMGISLPAFRIAGGVLLLLLSIDMVMARQSGLRTTTPRENEEAGNREDPAVFPLGIPLIAGPGAMTSVVLLWSNAGGNWVIQGGILIELVLVLVSTLIAFRLADRMMKLLGVTGVNVVTRVLGILLAALSVQFMIDGGLQVWRALA